MQRISHDLSGVTQRIAKLSAELSHCVDETRQVWRDEKGRAFLQQHFAELRPTIAQLVSGLTQSAELFEQIGKQLRDPDNN